MSHDPTYSIGYTISAVESNLAIIAASIPALWPLARRWFPAMDDKLGINRHYQADIEVQCLGDSGGGAAASMSPPRVKVKWTRTDTVRQSRPHLDSHSLSLVGGSQSSTSRKMSGEHTSRDALMLASSSFALPPSTLASLLPSPQEMRAEDEGQPGDYFGNFGCVVAGGPDRDSYHSIIAGIEQQHSPWGNHGHTLDEAAARDNERRMQLLADGAWVFRTQLGSSSDAPYSLPERPQPAAFRLGLPPRAKTTPAEFTLTIPPERKKKKKKKKLLARFPGAGMFVESED